ALIAEEAGKFKNILATSEGCIVFSSFPKKRKRPIKSPFRIFFRISFKVIINGYLDVICKEVVGIAKLTGVKAIGNNFQSEATQKIPGRLHRSEYFLSFLLF